RPPVAAGLRYRRMPTLAVESPGDSSAAVRLFHVACTEHVDHRFTVTVGSEVLESDVEVNTEIRREFRRGADVERPGHASARRMGLIGRSGSDSDVPDP